MSMLISKRPSEVISAFRTATILLLAILSIATLPLSSSLAADVDPPRTKRLLLLAQGPDGHPAGTHEYLASLQVLAKCLEGAPGLEVAVERADEPWPQGPELLKQADGVVLFLSEGGKWAQADPRRYDALCQLAARGGGIVGLHWGVGVKDPKLVPGFLQLVGACHGGPDRRFKVVEKAEICLADPKHPICAGLGDFDKQIVREEFYYRLKFVQPAEGIRPVVRVAIEGQDETVCWSWDRPGGGRSFGFTGLHFHDNWEVPGYKKLLTQGVLWTLNLNAKNAK
jgi:hypothetical protein